MAERPRRLRGLRVRLTVLSTAATAVVLGVAALLLVASLQRSLTGAGDDVAQARARLLADVVAGGRLPSAAQLDVEDGYAQVVAGSGTVLAASGNVGGAAPLARLVPDGTAAAVTTVTGPDDLETERYRVWAVAVPGQDAVAYVGTSLESVEEATRTLRRSLAVAVPALLGLLAAAAWLLVGRTLRPVEQIRAGVDAVSAAALDRRVPVPDTADEVARLAETMNAMLGRLEHAHAQQRDFVADASHELQSPLASLRTQLEVAASLPDADLAELLPGLVAETEQMERLVRDLLFLAGADSAAPGAPPLASWVDLDDLVLEEVRRLRGSARVTLDTAGVSAAPVLGDPDQLRRAVRNLLENAVRFARARVRVTVGLVGDHAVLVVSDDGPGVAPEDRERVFDRFRTGPAEHTRSGHAGLGLAIARTVVARHGGRLALVDSDDLGGARAVCELPTGG